MQITQAPDLTEAETAIETLAVDLVEEVFEHADRFLNENDTLNHWAIFKWLADIEQNSGLVSEATVGTRGSRWLLARQLGDTLQDTINHIQHRTAVERATYDMTQTLMFAGFLNLWNLSNNLLEDGPVGDVLKPSKVNDLE